MRATILAVLPDADEGMSYGVPAFRVDGRVVAGLAAFSHHLSYLPHSGTVLGRLGAELDGFDRARSSLHVPLDTPLGRPVIERLIATKLEELATREPAQAAPTQQP